MKDIFFSSSTQLMPLTNSEDEYVAHLQKISQDNTYSQPEASL
jgi:hypothetical protein